MIELDRSLSKPLYDGSDQSVEVTADQLRRMLAGETLEIDGREVGMDEWPDIVIVDVEERHYGPGSHPETGTPQEVHGGGNQSIAITVSADVAEVGETAESLAARGLTQPNGAPIRGTEVISPDDPRIPDRVYHMTTSLSGLEEAQEISARGQGGLGGDVKDRLVSMTIDEDIAKQLTDDFRLAVQVAQEFIESEPEAKYLGDGKWVSLDPETGETVDHIEWNRELVDRLNELDGQSPDWKFEVEGQFLDVRYSVSDWFRSYFIHRNSQAGIRNPIFMTDAEVLASHDLEDIGYVSIPKENIDTGALLMDFDLDRFPEHSLREIRLYGDVPLKDSEFSGPR